MSAGQQSEVCILHRETDADRETERADKRKNEEDADGRRGTDGRKRKKEVSGGRAFYLDVSVYTHMCIYIYIDIYIHIER